MLNNENTGTQGGEHHIPGSVVGWESKGRNSRGLEDWGGIILGEIPNVGDRGMEAANHHGMCISM